MKCQKNWKSPFKILTNDFCNEHFLLLFWSKDEIVSMKIIVYVLDDICLFKIIKTELQKNIKQLSAY